MKNEKRKEETGWVNRQGIRLAYSRTGSGESWLFLHGMRDTQAIWDPVREALSGRCSMITMDLRGHGWSDKPSGEYSFDILVDDIDFLIHELGLAPVNVAGHSLGGSLALYLAIRYPADVKRLACFGCGVSPSLHHFKPQVENLTPAQIVEHLIPSFFPKPRRTLSDETVDRVRDKVVLNWLHETEPHIHHALNNLKRVDLLPLLDRIKVPTFCIFAELDKVGLPRFGEMIVERVENGRLTVLEDLGHFFFLEAPDRFLQVMLPVLAGTYDIW
ncbi:MAG: alpha/beta hydrolase [bacterium]